MRIKKYPKIKGVDWSKIHDTNVRRFVLHVYSQITEAGGRLILKPAKSVSCDGLRVGGYFDSDENDVALAVAMGRPFRAWVRILVHEYSHFEQWRYDAPVWAASRMPRGEDAAQIFFDWLEGRDCASNKLIKAMYRAQAVELDCERRSVENIKRFNLPIDIHKYVQAASAYVYFYPYCIIRRRWYRPRHAPYMYPEILKAMPTTLSGDYRKLSVEHILLFDKYC